MLEMQCCRLHVLPLTGFLISHHCFHDVDVSLNVFILTRAPLVVRRMATLFASRGT